MYEASTSVEQLISFKRICFLLRCLYIGLQLHIFGGSLNERAKYFTPGDIYSLYSARQKK